MFIHFEIANVAAARRTGIDRARALASLVLAVLLAASGLVGSLLERGYSSDHVHIEVPNGRAADHPGQHDHGLCAVLGSPHGMPVVSPAPSLAASSVSQSVPVHAGTFLPQLTATALHSRAPPTA